jgi:hypothetical protein
MGSNSPSLPILPKRVSSVVLPPPIAAAVAVRAGHVVHDRPDALLHRLDSLELLLSSIETVDEVGGQPCERLSEIRWRGAVADRRQGGGAEHHDAGRCDPKRNSEAHEGLLSLRLSRYGGLGSQSGIRESCDAN